jgi:hypothetical protein
MAPWADHLYACDPGWWDRHKDLEFDGRKWSQSENWTPEQIEAFPDITRLISRPDKGICTEPGVINTGSNSGFQAINLAYHLGAKRIILLGFDMKLTGGKSHWFGDHPLPENAPPGSKMPISPYGDFIKAFQTIPPQLPDLGIEIINCTRSTALDCFPKKLLKSVL